MRRLVFTSGYPPYNAGEEATFEDEAAGALVSRGVADYVETGSPVAVLDHEPVDDDTATDEEDDDTAKGMTKPPADRMVRGSQTIRKKS